VRGSILVVDDEARLSALLVHALEAHGYEAESTLDAEAGLGRLKERPFDIVVTDLRLPGVDGLELLRRAKGIRPECEIVLMTGHATVETAREALKRGAVDYITKPFEIEDELLPLIAEILRTSTEVAMESPAPGSPPKKAEDGTPRVIGSSELIQSLIEKARRVARSNAPVLLQGESGTGKDIFAHLIHQLSPRNAAPMIRVNCAALPESLMESELFGYARGSFTGATRDRVGLFQAANGGTLFLDEIGEIPLALQPKLLRVLQDGEFHRLGDAHHAIHVNVRVIAATNLDLDDAVRRGAFRRDLFYRLNVVPIEIPPLRDHLEDLPELIDHFMRKIGNPNDVRLSEEALDTMCSYSWPGNVRELANAIEYALVLGDLPEIRIEDLPIAIQDHERVQHPLLHVGPGDANTLEDIEQRCIVQAMERTRCNRTRAAQLLGITRRTLGYRIQKYDLAERIEREADVARSDA